MFLVSHYRKIFMLWFVFFTNYLRAATVQPTEASDDDDGNRVLLIVIPIVTFLIIFSIIAAISYWQTRKSTHSRKPYAPRHEPSGQREIRPRPQEPRPQEPRPQEPRPQEPRPQKPRPQRPPKVRAAFHAVITLDPTQTPGNHRASHTNPTALQLQDDIDSPPRWWEIPARELKLFPEIILGSGQYGIVILGRVNLKNNEEKKCAVKTVKGSAGPLEKKSLKNELEKMSGMDHHPNIVNLIGAQTVYDNFFVVVEYCSNGSLYDYLKKHRVEQPAPGKSCTALKYATRLRIAFDIANGMTYLATKGFVHRDLAARNVLLDDQMRAKVSDFGRTRDTEKMFMKGFESVRVKNEPIPTRWMPVETLMYQVFTPKSDVWSYGVLLWEIETGGLRPYNDQNTYTDVFQKVVYENYRLEKPQGCPSIFYRIMTECWKDADQRPTFAQIATIIGTSLRGIISNPPTSPTSSEHYDFPLELFT